MQDTIYANAQPIVDFRFDQRVTAVFSDMIRRSVPGYQELIALLGLFGRKYISDNSQIYDLGCSLGAASAAVIDRTDAKGCRLILVDNSEEMIKRCRENLQALTTPIHSTQLHKEWRCSDIRNIEIERASLVLLNFTLQFIPPEDREEMLASIYKGMLPGGAVIVSEKIIFNDPQQQEILESLQQQFKRENGYSDLEIAQKRSALEQVLIPESREQHIERLQHCGFSQVNIWYQCLNFISIVAIK